MADTSLEEAKKLLVQEEQRRLTECKATIDTVCAQYDCELVAFPRYTQDGRTIAEIALRPIKR